MTGHENVSELQSMYEVFLRTAWYILKGHACSERAAAYTNYLKARWTV